MALQGTFYGTTANVRITPIIEWSATQSVAGNYSDITATLSYTKKNSNPTTGGRWTGSLTIGDNTKNVSSQYIEVYQDKITQVMTHTARVYHDSYGKATVTISATGGIVNPSSSTLQNTKISATVTLDTIPRASGVSATSAAVGKNPTITITRADASFTHTITYTFGDLTGTVAEKTKETTIKNWTIPESFYTQLSKKSGEGTLTCTTYSGSTKIGTATCKLSVTTEKAVCKPAVSGTVVDGNSKTIALTGDKNILVRYVSSAVCTISATGKNSAQIDKKTVNGKEISQSAITFSKVETGTYLFRAVDTRGYETEYPVEKTLVPYINLTARAVATRTDPTSGNARLRVEGSYYPGDFGAANNTLTVKYRQKGASAYTAVTPVIRGNTYWAEVTLTGLDYTRSFDYELMVEDKLYSLTPKATVGKGVPVFDWGEEDFSFHVPVYLKDGLLADYVVAKGTESMGDNGTWYWAKWASGKAECYGYRNYGDLEITTPWGALYETAFYQQALPAGLFVSVPTTTISIVATESGACWVVVQGNSGATESKTARFTVCRATSFTVLGARIGFVCKGRWK